MKQYLPALTVSKNRKGVLDIDTVKGCTLGMRAYPKGGCYDLCYAFRTARAYGMDFTKSVSRKDCNRAKIEREVQCHPATWFRIGYMGDPCHDWDWTAEVCEWLGKFKTPVVVTKHWITLSEAQALALRKAGAVVNTSTSPLDTKEEISYRLFQFRRLKEMGLKSVLRIVSAKFGSTPLGETLAQVQDLLFKNKPVIDNPLRIPTTDARVARGDILVQRHPDLGGGSTVSICNPSTYIGPCDKCPDLCGIPFYGEVQLS